MLVYQRVFTLQFTWNVNPNFMSCQLKLDAVLYLRVSVKIAMGQLSVPELRATTNAESNWIQLAIHLIWRFPDNGDTQNGWFFLREHPIKMDDDWGYPHDLGKLHIRLIPRLGLSVRMSSNALWIDEDMSQPHRTTAHPARRGQCRKKK